MTKGVVLADSGDLLVALLQRPVAEGMSECTCAITGNADHVLDALALGKVVSGNDRNEVRRSSALDVIRHGKSRVGEQISDQHVAIALLYQPARPPNRSH